jgi:signal-transduction protein with cAMP-binding, CBS, and nucleotidyltransferase domain
MNLSTCMRTPPVTCEMNATLAEVARMMEFEEVGSVLVMSEDNRIAGIVTDRDLVVRGIAREGGPMTRVETIMSSPVITVHETQDPFEAAAKMARAACRRLPVVTATGLVQGVVSLDDIMPLFAAGADRLASGTAKR